MANDQFKLPDFSPSLSPVKFVSAGNIKEPGAGFTPGLKDDGNNNDFLNRIGNLMHGTQLASATNNDMNVPQLTNTQGPTLNNIV